MCGINIDRIRNDTEAVTLSSIPLLCGIIGTHNLVPTSFLIEYVLSFTNLIQGSSVMNPITVSFQYLVGFSFSCDCSLMIVIIVPFVVT